MNGSSLKVQVRTEGRTHVKAAGAIDDAETRLKQVLLALRFVSEFVSLYQEWRDEMPPTEQYPPLTFFDDLAGAAARNNAQAPNQSYSLQFSSVLGACRPCITEHRRSDGSLLVQKQAIPCGNGVEAN